ncbi:MAG: GtrA family protein [Rhodospirillaceae bacterium]|nr:GtrA family protein [Rhodospirillaceae bacterium]
MASDESLVRDGDGRFHPIVMRAYYSPPKRTRERIDLRRQQTLVSLAMLNSVRTRLRQYLVYFCVGGFVGVLGVGFREVLGRLLPDEPIWYAASVAIAYGASILLSFSLHRRITFNVDLDQRSSAVSLGKFSAIAMIGLAATSFLAPALRYGLDLDAALGSWGAMAGFVLAALIVSVLTYALNALVTFRQSHQQRV